MYRIEIDGINALCQIFFGKRRNILRNRLESYQYINRQLFLATLLFSILLFVLPTILVYYSVFAIVMFSAYKILKLLLKIFFLVAVKPIYCNIYSYVSKERNTKTQFWNQS